MKKVLSWLGSALAVAAAVVAALWFANRSASKAGRADREIDAKMRELNTEKEHLAERVKVRDAKVRANLEEAALDKKRAEREIEKLREQGHGKVSDIADRLNRRATDRMRRVRARSDN